MRKKLLPDEQRFVNHLKLPSGYVILEALEQQDTDDHFDFILLREGKEPLLMDFKGKKRYARRDQKYMFDLVWVEEQNVNGKIGWIHGKADLIVFEFLDHYTLVRRSDLLNLVKKRVDWSARTLRPVSKNNAKPYTCYGGRVGQNPGETRDDKCCLVPTSDLEALAVRRIEKIPEPVECRLHKVTYLDTQECPECVEARVPVCDDEESHPHLAFSHPSVV